MDIDLKCENTLHLLAQGSLTVKVNLEDKNTKKKQLKQYDGQNREKGLQE